MIIPLTGIQNASAYISSLGTWYPEVSKSMDAWVLQMTLLMKLVVENTSTALLLDQHWAITIAVGYFP